MWILIAFGVFTSIYVFTRGEELVTPGVVLGLLTFLHLLATVRSMHLTARCVTASSDGLAATTFLQRRLRMAWDEVDRVQNFHVPLFGAMRRVRVISADGRARLLFTDAIERFDELLELIRANASRARYDDTPEWWKRLWIV